MAKVDKKSVTQVKFYPGDLAVDDRGSLSFVNQFDFAQVKRFYQVENLDTQTVRAWHGHVKESKYVYVSAGSIILGYLKLDSFTQPDWHLMPERVVLSAKKPQVVYIPGGYVNGFRALELGTKVIIYSTASLQDSRHDDYRFPYDFWDTRIWQVENR